MAITTISTEVLINHLQETHKFPDKKICFIFGSGASVESGIDSGAKLATKWYNELPRFHSEEKINKWKVDENFDKNNIPAFYSKLFELRFEGQIDNGITEITKIIEKGSPSLGYTILCQVLEKTRHNVVVTTNFDTLIEESLYIFTSKRALVCNHENVAHLAQPSSDRPLIIKVHRGLYMEPLNNNLDISTIKPQWEEALNNIFNNFIPIVIGYGGNDGSLMNFLKKANSCTRMYWCLYNNEKPNADMEEVVKRHKGSFVKISGFNRLMFRFINLFDLPKVHEVLEVSAKERTEKLRKEFEEAGKDIGSSGTAEEKQELSKVAEDFDTTDWLQWDLKAQAANDPKEKEDIYLQAISTLPNSHELLYNFACWLHEIKRYDDAIKAYQKAVEIKHDYYLAWNNMGVSYNKKNENDNAINAYLKAVEIKHDLHTVWHNMGISYKNKGQNENAITAYRKALEIKPDYHEVWNNLGISFQYEGDYDNAIFAYQKSIEIKPDYHEAWYNMGSLYNNNGEYDNAITAYQKSIEIKPDKHEAWYNIGLSYNNKYEHDNAITAYQKAVEIKPDYHEAWYNMGISYNNKGENNNAIDAYRKAAEIKPDKHEAWNNMGNSYLNKGEDDNAIDAYRKTIEIKPDYHKAWYNMGGSYQNKGDNLNARKCYNEAYKMNPDDQDYKNMVDSLGNE